MCREQGEGGWWWWRRRRRRRPGTRHACGGRARETREARKRGRRRRGVVRKARPPDPHRPHTRGEGARSRTQPSVHEGRSTPPAATPCRNEGRGGEGRGAAGPPLLPPHPTPRREPARPGGPGSRAGDPRTRPTPGTADAPSGARPSARPRGAGDAGRRGHGDRPAGGRPGGTRPALGRAHPERGARRGALVGGGWGVTGAPPRPARDDVGGQAAAAAAKRATDRGRGRPGGARHTRARPRGAADGERTEAGGRTDGEGHRRGAAT